MKSRPITLTSWFLLFLFFGIFVSAQLLHAQTAAPEKVIIDTDIGDDIDDAFALGLALRSPELQILGVTTTFGNTQLRAQLTRRFLDQNGRSDIPVFAGTPTTFNGTLSQHEYAEAGHFVQPAGASAAGFLLDQVRRYPNQVTLLAIGPLVNVGAAIDKDPATFRQLKRVIIMGGSIYRGYDNHLGYGPPSPPEREWNIINDIPSAQKLFTSGVQLYVMPLDSTILLMDEVKREYLFRQGTPLTDSLTLLYHQWGNQTPTLFDAMTVAFAVNPELCPVTPLHIRVDEKGYTRPEPGAVNAQACLSSSSEHFFEFTLKRLAAH